MIKNSKENMIHDVTASLRRTASWRRELCRKFNDHRNELAAKTLEELANVAPAVSDDYWSELLPYYDLNFSTWADAVSQASRHVEFRNIKTFAGFVDDLVSILSQPSSVAA